LVRELSLGDNCFIGVSHLAQEKARAESQTSSLHSKIKVIEAAVDGGATGFTFSTHQDNLRLLTHLSASRKDLLNRMNYYTLTPYGQSYVREANTEGTPRFALSVLGKIVGRPSAILDALASFFSLKPDRLAKLFIEMEIAPYLKFLPEERIKAILLHEIITEPAIAFGLSDLLQSLAGYVNDVIGAGFGLETRNVGYLHRWMLNSGYCPEYIMTPFNLLGYQMAPTKEATERSVKELAEKTKILAISVLASGAINFKDAIDYIARYEHSLYAVTGASVNPGRIFRNFRDLSRIFSIEKVQEQTKDIGLSNGKYVTLDSARSSVRCER
jgi:hypothetical protein